MNKTPDYVMVPRDDYDQALEHLASLQPQTSLVTDALLLLQRGARRDLGLQLRILTKEVYSLKEFVKSLEKTIAYRKENRPSADPGLNRRN